MVRRGNPVPILIRATISSSGVMDRESVLLDIKLQTEAFLRNPTAPSSSRRTFVYSLDPYEYQTSILSSVNGVAALTLTDFVRTDRGLMDIETITLDGLTEYPILSPQSTFI